MVDKRRLHRGKKTRKTIRFTENEIAAVNVYRQARYVEDNADLNFTDALREILRCYDWDALNHLDIGNIA